MVSKARYTRDWISYLKMSSEHYVNLHICCVRYLHGTVEEHIEDVGSAYDAVVASEVLEHVDNTDLFIHTCAEAIRVRFYSHCAKGADIRVT